MSDYPQRVHPTDAPFSFGGFDQEGAKVLRNKEEVIIECEIKTETLRAICIVQNDQEYWVPRSQIYEQGEGFIRASKWIAEQKEGLEWEPI